MARSLKHLRLRTSALANTIASLGAVPAAKAQVGRVYFCWDSSATGILTIYAGSATDGSTLLYTGPMSQGSTFEQIVTLLTGEYLSLSVNVANGGGVGILHFFAEEVDN